MMTSRAEYRLLLRQDNADLRLTPIGHKVGLISDERYEKLVEKKKMIDDEIERVNQVMVGGSKEVQSFLEEHKSTPLKTAVSLAELIRRPELSYEALEPLDKERKPLPSGVIEQVNINVKYEGYITRQLKQVEQFKKMEVKLIPDALDFDDISGLRIEAKQKLSAVRPHSVGQASRISGVTPADISVLLIYMEQFNRAHRSVEE